MGQHSGHSAGFEVGLVQVLWGGCGELLRLSWGGQHQILKCIRPPRQASQSVSDRRKKRSYEIEQAWYRSLSRADSLPRVANCLAVGEVDGLRLILLEDLADSGFSPTRSLQSAHLASALEWLAQFHASQLGQSREDLWEQGSYWHLETRPEEWQRMPAGSLKSQAGALDRCLRRARYQTVIHGDAKPANFLWDAPARSAAAVDFQYVGRGCGIRDVAYFLDGCLGDEGCQQQAQGWLDHYFARLGEWLRRLGHGQVAEAVEQEWRALFPVAWADFTRFWIGWAGHQGLEAYTRDQVERAFSVLQDPRWNPAGP